MFTKRRPSIAYDFTGPRVLRAALFEKISGMGWKEPSGILTQDPSCFFSLAVFLGIFPSVQRLSLACGTGAHRGSYDGSPRWSQTQNETMRQFSLHRHLMISNNEVTNKVGRGGTGAEVKMSFRTGGFIQRGTTFEHIWFSFAKLNVNRVFPTDQKHSRKASFWHISMEVITQRRQAVLYNLVLNWVTLKFINMSQTYRRPTHRIRGRRKQLRTKYINLWEKRAQERYGRIVTYSFWPILTGCASLHRRGVGVNMTPVYLGIKSCGVIKSLLHSRAEGAI